MVHRLFGDTNGLSSRYSRLLQLARMLREMSFDHLKRMRCDAPCSRATTRQMAIAQEFLIIRLLSKSTIQGLRNGSRVTNRALTFLRRFLLCQDFSLKHSTQYWIAQRSSQSNIRTPLLQGWCYSINCIPMRKEAG